MRKGIPLPVLGAILGAILGALLLPSCSEKLARMKGLTDKDFYARGQQMMAKKNSGDAIEAFQLLLERFPNSPLAPGAQLSLADAEAASKKDVEAESAYDDFLRLYPASDNVPYALSRKGELLFRQIGSPERDQTKTHEALKTFTRLVEKSPNSPYAAKARERVKELRTRLAEHEEAVAAHYLARKQYDSAEARSRRALADYPDTSVAPRLLSDLAAALKRQGKKEEAAQVRRTLKEKFPDFGAKKK